MNDDHYRRALIDDIIANGKLNQAPKTIEDDIIEILSAETKKAVEASKPIKTSSKNRLFGLLTPIKLKVKQNKTKESNSLETKTDVTIKPY